MQSRSLGQLLLGLVAAYFSLTIVVGSFALAMAQTLLQQNRSSIPNDLTQQVPMIESASQIQSPDPQRTTNTPLRIIQPGLCLAPSGWYSYTVIVGDSLETISQSSGVSIEQLQRANCMGSSTLIRAGQQIYIPRPPIADLTITTTVSPALPNTQNPPILQSTPELSINGIAIPSITEVSHSTTDYP